MQNVVSDTVCGTQTRHFLDVANQVKELGPWWHQIDLGNGIRTRDIAPQLYDDGNNEHPNSQWSTISTLLPDSLAEAMVLDVGCSDGFFSIAAAQRGAKRVVGIDILEHRIRNLAFASEHLGLSCIEPRLQSVYTLESDAQYSYGLMLETLHTLEHPLLALKVLNTVCETLIVSSPVVASSRHSYMVWGNSLDAELYGWIPTKTCLQHMLVHSGFTVEHMTASGLENHVTAVCRRSRLLPAVW